MAAILERSVCWAVESDGSYRFGYLRKGKYHTFWVTPRTLEEVSQDIERLATDPRSPLGWGDAAYLTATMRKVVSPRGPALAPVLNFEIPEDYCGCEYCRAMARGDAWWLLSRAVLAAAVMVAAFFLVRALMGAP